MPFLHFADVDQFAKIAALVTVCLYAILILARDRITSHQDGELNGGTLGGVLIAISIVGLAGVLAGAILGPHLM
jgi:hypothetical protein